MGYVHICIFCKCLGQAPTLAACIATAERGTLTLSLTLTLTLALTLTLTLALTLRLTYSIAAKVMRCTLRTGEACRRVICCTWVGVGATG